MPRCDCADALSVSIYRSNLTSFSLFFSLSLSFHSSFPYQRLIIASAYHPFYRVTVEFFSRYSSFGGVVKKTLLKGALRLGFSERGGTPAERKKRKYIIACGKKRKNFFFPRTYAQKTRSFLTSNGRASTHTFFSFQWWWGFS